jgi:DNA-binding NtrC family response regulator
MNSVNQDKKREQCGILIIEDEKLVAWDIEQIMRDNGLFPAFTTPSLRGARAALKDQSHCIGLAVLDLKLQDGDGAELIDEILQRRIPVLILTGYGNFRHSRVPVLYKPFLSGELVDMVTSLLRHHN